MQFSIKVQHKEKIYVFLKQKTNISSLLLIQWIVKRNLCELFMYPFNLRVTREYVERLFKNFPQNFTNHLWKLQGYPQRMRIQRRLYVLYTVCFLIYIWLPAAVRNHWICAFYRQRNWVFVTKSSFLIPVFFPSDGVNLWYFKLRFFYLTEFIVWNI